MMRRLVEQNPELQGVDLNTPEGQEKVRAVMQKRMEAEAPRMRQRMAEGQAAARAEIQKAIAMKDEEFAAITPLLERVETLRFHRTLVDRQGGPMGMMGGRNGRGQGGPGGGFGGMMPDAQVILGDTPLDPAAKEIQDALKALKSVVADPQANEAETELATARVRKAREAWQAAMTKAQEELRAVLTHHQEAILLDRGVIE
jgi:Spy/CpxP family protein refolding chaperone